MTVHGPSLGHARGTTDDTRGGSPLEGGGPAPYTPLAMQESPCDVSHDIYRVPMGNLHGADAPQWNGLRLIAFRDCSIHSPGHLYPTSECRACAQGSDLECDCTLHDEPQIKSSHQCTPALIQMRRKGHIGRESLTCPSPYALPNNRTRSSSWGACNALPCCTHP